jgi:hypothetical protein
MRLGTIVHEICQRCQAEDEPLYLVASAFGYVKYCRRCRDRRNSVIRERLGAVRDGLVCLPLLERTA